MEISPDPRQKTKGKQVIEEEEEEEGQEDPTAEMTCGICFSDDGRSIRGRIDSCEHYFCFVCIMEWAKVETRCPMCKQRFASIRRPTVPGIFLHERVVDVPERNQVCHAVGNESITATDPYANVICNECQTAKDEELLLLCDLCDSASHTYCVGLGATVPEGDWYCHDCSKIRDEHSRTQLDSESSNQDTHSSLKKVRASEISVQASQASVSVYEIVSDGIVSNSSQGCNSPRDIQTSQIPVSIYEIISDGIVSNPSPGLPVEQECVRQYRRSTTQRDSHDRAVSIRKTVQSTKARGEQHVRTLRQCRNLQDRIRQIRENWNFLRAGSLAFSPGFNNSSNRNYSNKRKTRVNSVTSREPESSSVCRERSVDIDVLSKTRQNAQLQDASKAWKMMKIAKSIEPTQKGPGSKHSSSLLGKGNISTNVGNHNPSPFVSEGYKHFPRGMGGHNSSKVVEKQHKCIVHKKQIPHSNLEKERGHFHTGPKIASQLESSPKPAWSSQEGVCCLLEPTTQQVVDEKLTVSREYHEQNFRGSSTLAVKPIVSASGRANSHDKKHSAVNYADQSYITRNDNMNSSAKDEVQSLVKLNLKLQSKNQLLDANVFREVARVATHTILAACGLGHSKSCARNIAVPKCSHSEEFREIRKSNLMPNSCRECFYSFVKVVVNSVFTEKIETR